MEIITKSEAETLAFGQKYAQDLEPGQILGLTGELGAGKTVFTKGLAGGLGIRQNVASPTFNLMRLYEIREPGAKREIKKFCHIDAYRAENEFEVIEAGVEDFMGKEDTVTVVEWADKIGDILPGRTVYVSFEIMDDNSRKIVVKDQ